MPMSGSQFQSEEFTVSHKPLLAMFITLFAIVCSISMLHQTASSDLFRFSLNPNHANGSAMPQRTAIGKNAAPPYLA